MSCGIGHRHGSALALLWLRCRPSAAVPIWPLASEFLHAAHAALKSKKTKQTNKKNLDFFNHFPWQNHWDILSIPLSKHIPNPFTFFFFSFLGPRLRHMEISRLGVQLELQLPAYATATATRDLSHVCNPHHSSRQHQILNPPSKARGRTHNLTVPSWIHFRRATMGTPIHSSLSLLLPPLSTSPQFFSYNDLLQASLIPCFSTQPFFMNLSELSL